jgi:phage-related protein
MASNKAITVSFYRSPSVNEPVRDWLLGLDKIDRQSVGIDIKTVEFGWPIGMPVCRPMGGGLYEVRTSLSSKRIARVLFCIEGKNMVLLHGFIKKTQKTSKQDLELAKARYKEVQNG